MYELWHVASRNLLEEFETESDALDAIRGYVKANDFVPIATAPRIVGAAPFSSAVRAMAGYEIVRAKRPRASSSPPRRSRPTCAPAKRCPM